MYPVWNIPTWVWSILIFSILIPLACGIAGGVIQSWFTHKFSEERESFARKFATALARETRKRDFIGKMVAWRTRVLRCNDPHELAAKFPAELDSFGRDYAVMEQDLSGELRSQFHGLCDQIVAMTDGEVERTGPNNEMHGKATLLMPIQAVTSLIERN